MCRMPEVRTGVGPGCTRSLGESAVRLVLEEVAASNWAFSACAEHSSMLTYFLYYIGQSPLRMWEGERRGGAGEFYCTDEGEESGYSFSFFFPPLKAGDGLSLPARRRTQAQGTDRGPEFTTSARGKDAPLLVLYPILAFCSGTPKMAATGVSLILSLKWGTLCSLWAVLGMQISRRKNCWD